MALEESSVLEAELARQSDPGRPEASGGQKRKQRKAPRDPPSERRLVEEAQEDPLRRQAEIEGLTAAGHQALVRGHKKEALSSFRKAFALSSETPRHGTQRVCAFNLGAAYVEAGRPEKGLALLLKAQPEEEGEAAGECLGDLFFNIGVAHEGLGDFGQALEAFRKAQGHYCAVQTESEAGTRMRMGDCYLGMGDPWRASQCFLEAGRSYAGAGRLELAATALSEATRLMLRSQEHEDGEVVKVLNECRELCEQIPDRALLGKLYNDIGLSFSELKIFSLAAESFAKALSFCKMEDGEEDRPTDEDAAAAAILQNLGATHNALGSFSTAVGFHQRAASLHSGLGNRRAQGQCFGNLAYALSQMGDHEAAVENYLHALQAFKDSGDLRGQWQSCEGLAGLRFHLGDPEKAVASYKEALMLISKCQDAPETAAQERIVNKLAEALQSKLSVSSRVLQGSGILTSRPARHFPMSQTFAASSLHRKKETFPPAACHASLPDNGATGCRPWRRRLMRWPHGAMGHFNGGEMWLLRPLA
ncbi:tetratricopeptide repeat protein 24 [Sceloporus undulatus]|uniref:tetratricopeptide repeat protein 24 n=1 Tax=Sceloporus undulatus TaxID=8520 RepID=UPI001C4C5155|nr:tetratricopeptide repeat protein 24 [Sceloporus undulatus]